MDASSGGLPAWIDVHSLHFYLKALIALDGETIIYESVRQQLFNLFERYEHLTTPPDVVLVDPIAHLESWAAWQSQAFADTESRARMHDEAQGIILNYARRLVALRDPRSPAQESTVKNDQDESIGGVSTFTFSDFPASERALNDDDAYNASTNEGCYHSRDISSIPPRTSLQKQSGGQAGPIAPPQDSPSSDTKQLCGQDVHSALLPGRGQIDSHLTTIPKPFQPGNTYGVSRHSVKTKGAAAIAPDHALQKLGTSETRTIRLVAPTSIQLLPKHIVQTDLTCRSTRAIGPGHKYDSGFASPPKYGKSLNSAGSTAIRQSAVTSMAPSIGRRSMPRSEIMLPTRTDPDARRANPSFQPHRVDSFLEASNRQVVYTSFLCALQHQPGGMSADCEDGALINCLNAACDRPYHICRKWWVHILCGGPPCTEGDVHHDKTFNSAVVGSKRDEKPRMAVHGIRPNCNSLLFGGEVYDHNKGPMDCGNAQCRFGHDKLSHRHQLALVGVKLGKDFRKELGYPKGKLLQLMERQ